MLGLIALMLTCGIARVQQEMASRHRVRYSSLSIIKTATVPPSLCKRDGTKQFHNSKIAFPVTQKLARCVATLLGIACHSCISSRMLRVHGNVVTG